MDLLSTERLKELLNASTRCLDAQLRMISSNNTAKHCFLRGLVVNHVQQFVDRFVVRSIVQHQVAGRERLVGTDLCVAKIATELRLISVDALRCDRRPERRFHFFPGVWALERLLF